MAGVRYISRCICGACSFATSQVVGQVVQNNRGLALDPVDVMLFGPPRSNSTFPITHWHPNCDWCDWTGPWARLAFSLLARRLGRLSTWNVHTRSLFASSSKLSMPWTVRVIAPLTADTEPALAIVCDQPPKKYLFNAGEGTTRACIQKRFGLSKTAAVMVTRVNTQQLGGFPGQSLRLEMRA